MGTIWRSGRVGKHDGGALALLADCAPAVQLRELRWKELLKDEGECFKAVADDRADEVPTVTAAGAERNRRVRQYGLQYSFPDEHALTGAGGAVARPVQQMAEPAEGGVCIAKMLERATRDVEQCNEDYAGKRGGGQHGHQTAPAGNGQQHEAGEH